MTTLCLRVSVTYQMLRKQKIVPYFMESYIQAIIGLTRSKKTSVMTTPKRPGTQICQIYPKSAGRCTLCQLTIVALNTITPNLADLPPNRT